MESRARAGSVTAFDVRRGLGEITDTGGIVYPFHCTQIADGSRAAEVGADVAFEVTPGPRGRWEATAIAPQRDTSPKRG